MDEAKDTHSERDVGCMGVFGVGLRGMGFGDRGFLRQMLQSLGPIDIAHLIYRSTKG